jgi:hypothetical protein
MNPQILRAFRAELEKRAFVNPVRVHQAANGLLPGRPLLTRFAKTRLGKKYVQHAPAVGDIAHNMHMSAQRGDPAFIVNTGIGGVGQGVLSQRLGSRGAEWATLLKREDLGIAGYAAGKLSGALKHLGTVGKHVGDAVETAATIVA